MNDLTINDIKKPAKPRQRLNKKQITFIDLWTDPLSQTFGNAYRSGLQAGFTTSYSKNLTHLAPKWLSEYMESTDFRPEHVKQAIQDVYSNPNTYNNAKSPADTRLKALELYSRITGMLDNKHTTNVTVVQPILSNVVKTVQSTPNNQNKQEIIDQD